MYLVHGCLEPSESVHSISDHVQHAKRPCLYHEMTTPSLPFPRLHPIADDEMVNCHLRLHCELHGIQKL